jgi:hypothetical protein
MLGVPFPQRTRLGGQSTGQTSSGNQYTTQGNYPETQGDYPEASDVGALGSPHVTNLVSPVWLQPSSGAAPQNELPNAKTYKKAYIDARLHHPESAGWPSSGLDNDWATPGSQEGRSDWSAYLQPAQVILPSAITGDPRIDRTTEILLDTLVEAVNELGVDPSAEMRSVLFGTLAHSHFARKVRTLDLPGIGEDGVEQNWHMGDLWDYGISGAKRTDVYLKDPLGNPIAIYDLKTGNARLTRARIRELREAVGVKNIPVIELRWRDVMALQR